jgi:hypothetical protein
MSNLVSLPSAAAPDALLARARQAERQGELDEAVTLYNQLLVERPDHPDALLALARLLTDRGQTERAVTCYERLLQLRPEDADAALELGLLHEAAGQVEEAVALYQKVASQTDDRRLDHAARAAAPAPAADPPPATGTDPSTALACPADAHAVTLCELFAGREGVHARQWVSDNGRAGYSPVREPFTPAVARNHLMGTYTVGVYPLRLDNSVRLLCFDLDLTKEALKHAAGSVRSMQGCQERVQQTANALHDRLAGLGIPSHLEDSGYKGRHVWVLFEEPVPARVVRRLARRVLAGHELPDGVQIEVFPRQSRVNAGSLGNLVKLPLGVHRRTGRRALFVDDQGRPLPAPLDVLLRLRRVSTEAVASALEALEDSDDEDGDSNDGKNGSAHGDEGLPPGGASPAAPPAPRGRAADLQAPYRLEEDLEVQQVLAGCPVLADICRRLEQTGQLTSEERLVLTHTLGCLGEGHRAVNHLLSRVSDLDATLLLSSRLRGNPTSCQRIRSRLPDLTERVCADCSFDCAAGHYPTPLLHATGPGQRLSPGSLELDRTVRDYVKLRAELSRVGRAVEELGQRLRRLMSDQGLDALTTSLGTLRSGPGENDLILELAG